MRVNRAIAVSRRPIPRSKRPYGTLLPTQKRERRKQALIAATQALKPLVCPLEAIQPVQKPKPADVIHLSTSTREQIRSVSRLHIPSEKLIIRWKKQLALSHATETGTFVGGAYITDPLAFVSILSAQSPFIAVGGDCGGEQTKIGITYLDSGVQRFACLLVYEGGDTWLELQDCRAINLTPFKGQSATFPHIWAVLQHLIATRQAFLNGDWCFLNAVLGLMSPSSTHPCPVCIVNKNNLLSTARYRKPEDEHSLDFTHRPLLTIDPERIVPTPLHLFLGIGNRIVLDVLKELLGEDAVKATIGYVKSKHSVGCGGLSDLFDLNGAELSKFVKKNCSRIFLAAADASSPLPASIHASHSILERWLKHLHHFLLHSHDFTAADLFVWRTAVEEIHLNWTKETSQNAFPKLHMLHHAVDFAERHRFLGRISEAQMESFHASFNALFHRQHRNMSKNTEERIRRSLADAALRAVQPCLARVGNDMVP